MHWTSKGGAEIVERWEPDYSAARLFARDEMAEITVAFAALNPRPIPPGSMRVAPGSDAVVWLTAPKHGGEL